MEDSYSQEVKKEEDDRQGDVTVDEASTNVDNLTTVNKGNHGTTESVVAELPTSTVAVIVKDVEGSTSDTTYSEKESSVSDGTKSAVEEKASNSDSVTIAQPPSASVSASTQSIPVKVFKRLTCLGSSTVNAPRSETEAHRVMSTMKENSAKAIEVDLSVPTTATGSIILLDPITRSEISKYPIERIVFCVRGNPKSSESDCFSFSYSYENSDIYYIHVFRCMDEDSASMVLQAIGKAFKSSLVGSSSGSPKPLPSQISSFNFHFDISVDISEQDNDGSFQPVPRENNFFKIRANRIKRFSIILKQSSGPTEISISKCTRLMLSPGSAQMAKTDKLVAMNELNFRGIEENQAYEATGVWNPITTFNVNSINVKTPRAMTIALTVAIDIVFDNVVEPVRLLWDMKIRVYDSVETVSGVDTITRHRESFKIQVKKVPHQASIKGSYRVTGTQRVRLALSVNNVDNRNESGNSATEDEETVLSGSGSVHQDCSDNALIDWSEVLTRWRNSKSRPKELISLVRKGIPEPLRGQVWQMLADIVEDTQLLQNYSHLLQKESASEKTILVDLGRTFPGHPFFKEQNGEGQENLYRVCKAYSVYDEEIGYCQGLSFVVAVLILHMPEEQAFCILVKLMYTYGLRDLFRSNFEQLHVKLFQLEKLLERTFPDLYYHFQGYQVETHMFASQWFLTLFTAKFPLAMAYHVMDMFLCEGIEVLFRVAIAILTNIGKELLATDFEGIMKFFRVTLPKRCLLDEFCSQILLDAGNVKIGSKKLRKYEKEYYIMKEISEEEDPVLALEEKNRFLMRSIVKIRQNNEAAEQELANMKRLHSQSLVESNENISILKQELKISQANLVDIEEGNSRIRAEIKEVKELYRETVDKSKEECARQEKIVGEYKQICSQQGERLEKQRNMYINQIRNIREKVVERYPELNSIFTEEAEKSSSDNFVAASLKRDANVDYNTLEEKFRELEVKLAQAKLESVEKECKIQDLEHHLSLLEQQLTSLESAISKSGPNWFTKWKRS